MTVLVEVVPWLGECPERDPSIPQRHSRRGLAAIILTVASAPYSRSRLLYHRTPASSVVECRIAAGVFHVDVQSLVKFRGSFWVAR